MIRFQYPGAPRVCLAPDGGAGGGDFDLRSLGTAIERHAAAMEKALATIDKRSQESDGRLGRLEAHYASLAAGDMSGLTGRAAAADAVSRAVAADEGFKSFVERRADKAMVPISSSHFLETRNTITSTVSGDSIVPSLAPQRLPGILAGPERKRWLHSLMPEVKATGGSVEYVRESAFTNNAAAQSAEGAAKAQSSLTLTLEESKVATIAHWLKSSRQALSDSAALREYLDRRLRYGTLLALEAQLVGGDGASGRIKGLTHEDNHTDFEEGPLTDQAADAIRRAIGQLDETNFEADAVILHPSDWTNLEILKDEEGRYLLGNPSGATSKRIWAEMIHTTPALPAGKFIVASLGQATMFHPREDANLIIALDGDDLTKNLVTLLAELRATMTVPQPGGVIYGDLPGDYS